MSVLIALLPYRDVWDPFHRLDVFAINLPNLMSDRPLDCHLQGMCCPAISASAAFALGILFLWHAYLILTAQVILL